MRRHAPAAIRNRQPILDVLRPHLPATGLVLEVASGSGEHVMHFAASLPRLVFQPSDPDSDARASIDDWARESGLANVRPAVALDAQSQAWPVEQADAVLGVRETPDGEATEVDRADWHFRDATHIEYPAGFRLGAFYELTYRAQGARPTGAGLAALSDLASFLRYDAGDSNPGAGRIDHVDTVGAVGLHKLRLACQLRRGSHVGHHEKARYVHSRRPREFNMLLGDVGFRAMRGDPDRTRASFKRLAQVLNGPDSGN